MRSRPRRGPSVARSICLLLLSVWLGCSRSRPQPVAVIPTPLRMTQQVMVHRNFASFLANNRARLKACWQQPGCDVPLFNLGFLHTYVQSPYYDLPTALEYFDELIHAYPNSPWAFQARIWMPLLRENLALAEQRRDLEENQRALETHLRNERTAVQRLKNRLDRARQVDIELEEQQRELFRLQRDAGS